MLRVLVFLVVVPAPCLASEELTVVTPIVRARGSFGEEILESIGIERHVATRERTATAVVSSELGESNRY